MLDWVENRLLASDLGFEILTSLLFPFYKLSWKNSPKNMCDIVFEKVKDRGDTVYRISVYAIAGAWRVL